VISSNSSSSSSSSGGGGGGSNSSFNLIKHLISGNIHNSYRLCVECLTVGIGSGTCTCDQIKIRIALTDVTWGASVV